MDNGYTSNHFVGLLEFGTASADQKFDWKIAEEFDR